MGTFKLLQYETLDSTNEEAKRLLDANELSALTAIVARSQTAGKGTQGRRWVSPPGAGLYLSIVHPFPDAEAGHVPMSPLFTLAAGVACAETLQEMADLEIALKPVNDLYFRQKKLGGILTESLVHEGRFKALITGIGINLLPAERTFDAANRRGIEPICLHDCMTPEQVRDFDAPKLIEQLVESVDFWYQYVLNGNHAFLLNRYIAFQLPETELPAGLMS